MFATRGIDEERCDTFIMCNKHDRGNIYNSSSRAFREWAAGGSGFDVNYSNGDDFGHKSTFDRDDDGFPIVQSPNSASRMKAETHRSSKRTTEIHDSSRMKTETQEEHVRWPVDLSCEKVRSFSSDVQPKVPKSELGHSFLKNLIPSHQDGVRPVLGEEITHRLLRHNEDLCTGENQCTTNGPFRFFGSVGGNKTASQRHSAHGSNIYQSKCESHKDMKPGIKPACDSYTKQPLPGRSSTCSYSSKNPTGHAESINRTRTKHHSRQILSSATNPFLQKPRQTSGRGTSLHTQSQHSDIILKSLSRAQPHRLEGSHSTDYKQQTQQHNLSREVGTVSNCGSNNEKRRHSNHHSEQKGTITTDDHGSSISNSAFPHTVNQPRRSQRTTIQVESSTASRRTRPRTRSINKMNTSSRSSADKPNKQQHIWKTATCPKTGKTYYYDAVTRQTQWHKPMELASKSERAETARKEKKQRDFFAAMEANILRSMAQGVVPGTPKVHDLEEDEDVAPLTSNIRRVSSKKITKPRPKLVRTISAMDDTLLANLTRVEASDDESSDNLTVPFPKKSSPTSVAADIGGKMEEDRAVDQAMRMSREMVSRAAGETSNEPSATKKPAGTTPSKSLPKPNLTKRNTCGTIYIGSTMSAPDTDASIKCVCGVFRAHLLQSVREETNLGRRSSSVKFDEYEIFNDHPDDRHPSVSLERDGTGRRTSFKKQGSLQGIDDGPPTTLLFRTETGSGIEALSLESSLEASVPSLDDITNFYRDVFRRSQMEADCIIMSLIYVERLIKDTNGGVRPKPSNWRSILFSCMVMSSKVWDDLSMWNADFSQTCPRDVSFSLQRINELELAVLACLKYNVKVTASEYAKYYFLLRSMLIRSGLAGEDMTNTPLNIEGVKKLEHMSANYQVNAETKEEVSKIQNRRGKSLGCLDDNILNSLSREFDVKDDFDDSFELDYNGPSARTDPNNSSKGLKASLEHFVQL